MAEIYIGNNKIGGGSADLSGYVDVSTFDDVTHTTAAALVNLKILHNEQAKYIMDLSTNDTKLDNDISTLFSVKADTSNYYTKNQIDDDGKVVAAALASLDSRVSSIESSVGDGSGSGGGEVDLSVINASVNNIENDYVKSEDIANFITADYTYDKSHIDASFIEVADMIPTVPTAISSFTNDTGYITDNDTSVYALKSEIDSSFADTYLVKITNASGYYCYVPRTMSANDRQTVLSKLNTNGAIVLTVPNNQALSNKIGSYSINTGYRTNASGLYSHAEGSYSESKNWYSHAEGYFTCTSADYQHVEGKYNADASTAIQIVGNGNGTGTSSRHNALEVHLSGELKIADTHATGEAYQKPMYVLQDKLYQIDSSLSALVNAVSGIRNSVTTESLILEPNVGVTSELYIRDSYGDLYQIDIDTLC